MSVKIDRHYNKYFSHNCNICGKEHWVQRIKGNLQYERCLQCALKSRKLLYGAEHPSWKGGKRRDNYGYIRVKLKPDDFFHPMTTSEHYVMEHRLVMAKYLGRCLHSWETVHHKNHIKDDNRIENLQLVSDLGHKQITRLEMQIKRLKMEVQRLKSN